MNILTFAKISDIIVSTTIFNEHFLRFFMTLLINTIEKNATKKLMKTEKKLSKSLKNG